MKPTLVVAAQPTISGISADDINSARRAGATIQGHVTIFRYQAAVTWLRCNQSLCLD